MASLRRFDVLLPAMAFVLIAACGSGGRDDEAATWQRIHVAAEALERAGDPASRPGGAQARVEVTRRIAQIEAAIATLPAGAKTQELRGRLGQVNDEAMWILDRGAAIDAYPALAARLEAARARLEPLQEPLLRAMTAARADETRLAIARRQEEILSRMSTDLRGLPDAQGQELEDRWDRVARDTAIFAAVTRAWRTDENSAVRNNDGTVSSIALRTDAELEALAPIEAALPELIAAEEAWMDAGSPLLEARLTVADLRGALDELEALSPAR